MSDGFIKTIQDIRDKTNELGFQNKQIDGDTLNTWQEMLRTRPVRLLIERLLGRSAVRRAMPGLLDGVMGAVEAAMGK